MEHTRTITREFTTGENAVLHMESRSGAVAVEAGAGASVRVEAIVHVWSDLAVEADEAASLVGRGMEQDAHRVIIRAPSMPQTEGWSLWGGKRGSRVDYTVRVPSSTAVRVLSRSGRVQISRTKGRVHVEAISGRCGVDHITGNVTAVARSGSLTIEHIEGDVTAETKSGRVEVGHVSGTATVEARSGTAELRDIGGELRVATHTGAITIEDAHAAVRARAQTGAIRYRGRVEADMDMKAHTGLIQLAVDPAQPFFIDAESSLGSVRSDLPPRRGGSGSADGAGPKVRLRTHTGAIRLTRA
ncbi:MAG TPA: DUF4097 family beta strand repeat-containing protein [Dehalococcoidia bacterium]|nr:DUF4097 family beta strand repeat-containing protein [Dehalococcoidia bacterium]